MPTIPKTCKAYDEDWVETVMRSLPGWMAAAFMRAFAEWAHRGQVAPAGDWRTWVLRAGRGFGKTRAGAEWVLALARLGVSGGGALRDVPLPHPAGGSPPPVGEGLRIALVAATVDEARRVMVEGASGILACARPDEVEEWSRDRGALVTTTPRGGCAALKRLLAAEGTVLTGGTTRDNPHLPAAFLAAVEAAYGGTRMGREELDGELLDDVHGSLWPVALVERCRGTAPGVLARVVVGVDPPASAGGTCGIVACGLDADGTGWVLADHSASGLSPEGWARKVAAAAEVHDADRIVVENNQGGDMVVATLRACFDKLSMSGVPVTAATATCLRAARRGSRGGSPSSKRSSAGWCRRGMRGRAVRQAHARPTGPTRWCGRCGRCCSRRGPSRGCG